MSLKNIILFVLSIAAISLSVYTLIEQKHNPKIAYVKTKDVLEKYIGMQEAQELYQLKVEKWSGDFDSISNYMSNQSTKGKGNLFDSRKSGDLENYQRVIEKKAEEENLRLTQGVLNKVNQFIESYAREKNIEIIFGVTAGGNILYGGNILDVTNEVIDGLNKQYKGK